MVLGLYQMQAFSFFTKYKSQYFSFHFLYQVQFSIFQPLGNNKRSVLQMWIID